MILYTSNISTLEQLCNTVFLSTFNTISNLLRRLSTFFEHSDYVTKEGRNGSYL